MPHFFVDTAAVRGSGVVLTGENAHHAAYALRLAVGDAITVSDQHTVYDCVLTHFGDGEVTAEIREAHPADAEPPYRAVLFQALPKGDKLDTVIQKAVECGVAAIIPFESSRCIMRAKPETEERKTQRRARIAEEAAKQSRRGLIPEVMPTVTDYAAVLRQAAACDLALFCYEGEGTRSLRTVLDGFVRRRDVCLRWQSLSAAKAVFLPRKRMPHRMPGSACADWVGASCGQRRRRALY